MYYIIDFYFLVRKIIFNNACVGKIEREGKLLWWEKRFFSTIILLLKSQFLCQGSFNFLNYEESVTATFNGYENYLMCVFDEKHHQFSKNE